MDNTQKQLVFWIPESRIVLIGDRKPWRVWTLIQRGEEVSIDNVPSLPIVPQHLDNAFLEDHIHDWSYQQSQGTLRYYSRVALNSVWVLCEFKG